MTLFLRLVILKILKQFHTNHFYRKFTLNSFSLKFIDLWRIAHGAQMDYTSEYKFLDFFSKFTNLRLLLQVGRIWNIKNTSAQPNFPL